LNYHVDHNHSTHKQEATGVARAAAAVGVPCIISFTVETNGRLPCGASLATAITTVDDALEHAVSALCEALKVAL
jgi:homocysteine S-methyltransferase